MAGKSKYKTYSPEFKEEAARLVVDTSRPIADGNWIGFRSAVIFGMRYVAD